MSINTILEGTGRIKIAVASLIFGAGVKCILSFFLIGTSNIGALGAPISTSISYMSSAFFSLTYLKKDKKIKINISKAFVPSVIPAALALVPALIVKQFTLNVLNVRLNSLLILITYGIFYILFCLFTTIRTLKQVKISAKCTKNQVYDY